MDCILPSSVRFLLSEGSSVLYFAISRNHLVRVVRPQKRMVVDTDASSKTNFVIPLHQPIQNEFGFYYAIATLHFIKFDDI